MLSAGFPRESPTSCCLTLTYQRQGLRAQRAIPQGLSCHCASPDSHPWPSSATLWQTPSSSPKGVMPLDPHPRPPGPWHWLSLLIRPPALVPSPLVLLEPVTLTQHKTSHLIPVLPLKLFPVPVALPKHLQGSSNSSRKWVLPALPPASPPGVQRRGAPLPPPSSPLPRGWFPGTLHYFPRQNNNKVYY